MFKLKATEPKLEERVSRPTPNFPVLVTTIPGLAPRIPGYASHGNCLQGIDPPDFLAAIGRLKGQQSENSRLDGN